MNKIYTLELNGRYLMQCGPFGPDWTTEWEHAHIYTKEKAAKRDRDYLGISLAKLVEYVVTPPPLPKEVIPVAVEESWGVYFIVERHQDPTKTTHLKVGYSKDPQKRLKQLQTGHPNKLGLLGWLKADSEHEAKAIENQIHMFFENYRAIGEWFKYNGAVKTYVDLLREEEPNFVRFFS